MADQNVIPYNPDESDLTTWDPIAAEELSAGNPIQRAREYFQTSEGAITSGFWDCTAFETHLAPYSVNEFMILLEGSVFIIDANGTQYDFHAGQSFVIPKGLNCIWKQTGLVRKFYVIFDDPSAATAADQQSIKPILINHDMALEGMTGLKAEDFVGELPTMSIRLAYQDPTGQFDVGVWESAAMTRVPATIGRSELMHILQGSGEIVNGDGIRFAFNAGDTFMVPIGMGYQWDSKELVKKIFCSFTPG